MNSKLKKFITLKLVFTLLLASCEAFRITGRPLFYKGKYDRVKRQYNDDGYVYKRPSIAFDLPSRPTSSSRPTQTSSVSGRTLSQMMFYAYPVPASKSDTVNIGFSTSSTAAPSTATGGYNYQTQGYGGSGGSRGATEAQGGYTATSGYGGGQGSTGYGGGQGSTGYGSGGPNSGGYSYGAPSTASPVGGSVGVSAVSETTSSGSVTINSGGYGGVQNTVGTQLSTGSSSPGPTGYNYGIPNTPSSTAATVQSTTPSIFRTTAVSTNAPKYLPPIGREGNAVATGGGTSTSGSIPIPAVPSDAYLPPVQTPAPAPTSARPVPTVTTGYLPPNSPAPTSPSSPSPSPIFPVTNPSVASPTTGYLPPISNPVPTQGVVSTPAVTYLPPVF